ncbi:phosphatidylserine decarboxylase family protein [Motilimonas pumila]|uniref:Phosphatidylserine decarboxylase family protein n=1 Tax=Motilimonas pumila TaxID=2303987 RepID=A0A418YIE7_9GAMM|nr:phosphatidylserine decarboxylase family protein [Motilimonas pumila]RJG50425.1 phosphatidylserine decarboxylase family protein [Motilimonas pumila]
MATPYRVGAWLPSDHAHLSHWLKALAEKANQDKSEFHPSVAKLKHLIETDAEIYMLFNQMWGQIPNKPPYNRSPTNKPAARNYLQMLRMINLVLTHAPEFLVDEDDQPLGLIGCPINAILDWAMGTTAGYAAFIQPKVNRHFKDILDAWGAYLMSPDSASVLNEKPNGWFGCHAKATKELKHFDEMYICSPEILHHGFHSWDDFFTRQFRPGQRPVAAPGDDNVVVNACESAPFRCSHNVQRFDAFWIKSQCYSLIHMLDSDPLTDYFEGGTVYQAFLSALSYHRWHAPVSGRIISIKHIPGTYYSEPLVEGFNGPDGPDPSGPNDSQGYITEVATRALVVIQADNPALSLVGFLAVGMAEVSTCDVTVEVGKHVSKGEQLGMFHFGGSTHCLIFSPKVKLAFDFHGQTPGLDASNIPINSAIARVVSET